MFTFVYTPFNSVRVVFFWPGNRVIPFGLANKKTQKPVQDMCCHGVA